MDKNNIKTFMGVLLGGFVLVLLLTYYVLYIPHRDILHEESVKITANQLIREYGENEDAANQLFLDKALEISGQITNLENNANGQTVVVLAAKDFISSVRCTFLDTPPLRHGDKIMLRGRCTGFLNDVVVIDCSLIK